MAIIEDNDKDAKALEDCLARFRDEEHETFKITRFTDGMEILQSKNLDYDIIYMDIEMPLLNGMDAAKQLREMGCRSALVFVTNMAQYAIRGYEVEAVSFTLKPIMYASFSTLLKKLISRANREKSEEIVFYTNRNAQRVSSSLIRYVESVGHKIFFHTQEQTVEYWGALSKIAAALPSDRFVRCNSCYIVNLSFVKSIKQQSVVLDNDEELIVSRPKRRELVDAFQRFLLNSGNAKFL